MDQLKYYYDAQTNRLNHVYDSVPNSTYTEDIETQDADNYGYDKIGNLKRDVKEGITDITWNVYGKIESIVKSGNTITYVYDAAGNRISKTVSATNLTTVYVRDASGN